MPTNIRIAFADDGNLKALLPLISDYQKFYGFDWITSEQNQTFFARLLRSPQVGKVIIAVEGDAIVGFATGFFTFSGALAEPIVHMGDIYVIPTRRSAGIGKLLIDAVVECANQQGIRRVRWLTNTSNTPAQHLYDAVGATKSDILLYTLKKAKNQPPSPP